MSRSLDLRPRAPAPEPPDGPWSDRAAPLATSQAVPAELRLRDAWDVVRRSWPLIAACLAAALLLAVAYLARARPVYRAGTSLLVEQEQRGLQPLDRSGSRPPAPEVETEMEVLRSGDVVGAAVRRLGLQVRVLEPEGAVRAGVLAAVAVDSLATGGTYRLEAGGAGTVRIATVAAEGTAAPPARTAPAGQPIVLAPGVRVTLAPGALRDGPVVLEVRDLDVVVDELAQQLRVSRPNENANVIRVSFDGTDPVVVRDVPDAVADEYLVRRQGALTSEARGTAAFLAQQLDTVSRQLAQAEEALRAFREREGVVAPATEATSGIAQRSQLEAERTTLEAERSALARVLADARAQGTGPDGRSPYRRLAGFPALIRNPTTAELLRSLTTIEDQRALLLQRRTLEDPSVQVLTERTRELEEQLRGLAVTYYQGLAGQVASLEGALSRSGRQLARLPAREAEFERLQRTPTTLREISALLQTRLKEAQIAQAVEDASVRVIDRATLPRVPVKPNKILVLGLAGMLGLGVGLALAFLRTQLRAVIHTRDDLRRLVPAPVLGVIPRAPAGGGALAVPVDGQVAEAYRRLRTNVLALAPGEGRHVVLLVTSTSPGEGKTTVAMNLAAALAQQGARVLLADADLRRASVTTRLLRAPGPGAPGLATALQAAEAAPAPAGRLAQGVEVGGAHFDVLGAGALPAAPADLLAAPALLRLFDRLRAEYDIVVIDSPSVNTVADAAVLAEAADGVLLVVRAGQTSVDAIGDALEQLATVRAPLLGLVLNGARPSEVPAVDAPASPGRAGRA